MALVNLSHVSVHYGGPTLFRDATLSIDRGQKIGVIGQNGTGKSTLLKLVSNQLEPTEGEVYRQRGVNIAYQEQELQYAPGATVIDDVRRVFAADEARAQRLRDLEQSLASSSGQAQERLLAQYERLQHEHEAAGGYRVEQRIASTLSGLGLPQDAWQQPIETFSGGERNIVGLAKIMLQAPDVMLLDEPSNHLDLDGIEWFIHFVRQSEAAVVMVSHNRHVLDATVDTIWEVRGAKIYEYTGNYSDFMQQREEALALQERQHKVQQRLIKRLEFQARRLMDMANAYDDPGQAKRAKVMRRRIEQMDIIEAPNRNEKRFRATLAGGKRHGRLALNVNSFSFTYPGDETHPRREIFSNANLMINFGERVALVGPNGCGKSTLFKAILEKASWENEVLRIGQSVTLGEYSQLHDALEEERPLLDWLQGMTGLNSQPASELLHRFLFTREDLKRPISSLSGGEKSRLQLAKLVHEKVNFLLLDEPTNHLDIQACEQLEDMLLEFEGSLLVISHDRNFLERLVSRVVEVQDQQLASFDGTFHEWWQQRESREGSRIALTLRSQRDAADKRESGAAQEREDRKARQREQHRLRKEMRSLEDRISQLEKRQSELESLLSNAFSEGADFNQTQELNKSFASVRDEIASAYQRWEEVALAIEGE